MKSIGTKLALQIALALIVIMLLFGMVSVSQGISMSCAQSASIDKLIAEGAKPELLAGGFKFTEGPAADAAGASPAPPRNSASSA